MKSTFESIFNSAEVNRASQKEPPGVSHRTAKSRLLLPKSPWRFINVSIRNPDSQMNKPTYKLGGNLKKKQNNKIQSNTKSAELYIEIKKTKKQQQPAFQVLLPRFTTVSPNDQRPGPAVGCSSSFTLTASSEAHGEAWRSSTTLSSYCPYFKRAIFLTKRTRRRATAVCLRRRSSRLLVRSMRISTCLVFFNRIFLLRHANNGHSSCVKTPLCAPHTCGSHITQRPEWSVLISELITGPNVYG